MPRPPVAVAFLLATSTPLLAQEGPGGTLVVVNKAASTASLIDVASGGLLATLPTGTGPHEVVVSRDGRTAVVSDYGTAQVVGRTLTVIDVRSRAVARTIDMGTATRPHGMAFLPGDSLLAVTSETTRQVSIVRVGDGTIVRRLPTDAAGSHMLAITGDGGHIVTGNIGDASVSDIDVAEGTVRRTWPVPTQPEAITVSGGGDEVWVGSNNRGLVSVLTTATGAITTAATEIGWPYRIVLVPGGRSVLIPDLRHETLRVLDRDTGTERHRFDLTGGAPQGITVTPDGRFVFQSLSGQDKVLLIDLDALAIVRELTSLGAPDGVGWARP